MKRRNALLASVLAAGLVAGAATAAAQAPAGGAPCPGSGMGYGQGRGMHHGMQQGMHQGHGKGMMAPHQQAARLAALKDALKLQPAQMDAWNGFEARLVAQRDARSKHFEQMQKLRDDPDALADFRVATLQERAKDAAETNTARKALVATLTPEQKVTFDSFRRGPMGPGGPGHRHGYGPGAQS
ncbi:MAG: Spy/CpxP family protein refolding chaperone [Betaproteobacteria bacterium]